MDPITPADVASWKAYLAEWETKVYQPIFLPRKISRDAALIAWAHYAKPFPAVGPVGSL